MNDEDRQQWSRHYDKLQWGVIGIVSAGVGVLLAKSFDPLVDESWPELFGLALTILGAAYVWSFRRFRKFLHEGIANLELRDFLLDPGRTKLKQWHIFIASCVVVDAVFVCQFIQKS